MQLADIPQVQRIDNMVFGVHAWPAFGFREKLENPADNGYIILYDDENPNLVLGYAGVTNLGQGKGLVTLVAVHPDLQSRHIGEYLMKLLFDWGRRHGIHQFFLQTKVNNVNAHKLYLRTGFNPILRIPNYYHQTGEDALLWRC